MVKLSNNHTSTTTLTDTAQSNQHIIPRSIPITKDPNLSFYTQRFNLPANLHPYYPSLSIRFEEYQPKMTIWLPPPHPLFLTSHGIHIEALGKIPAKKRSQNYLQTIVDYRRQGCICFIIFFPVCNLDTVVGFSLWHLIAAILHPSWSHEKKRTSNISSGQAFKYTEKQEPHGKSAVTLSPLAAQNPLSQPILVLCRGLSDGQLPTSAKIIAPPGFPAMPKPPPLCLLIWGSPTQFIGGAELSLCHHSPPTHPRALLQPPKRPAACQRLIWNKGASGLPINEWATISSPPHLGKSHSDYWQRPEAHQLVTKELKVPNEIRPKYRHL